MKSLIGIFSALTVLICFSKLSSVYAAEYPGVDPITEHPSSPTEEHLAEQVKLSADEIIKGTKDHIESVTKNNLGFYPLHDDEEDADIRLKLLKINDDKVSYLTKEKAYFACTDFISYDGKAKYDVDFWMKKGKDDEPQVYQIKIHKKDDEPRFIYKDDEIVPVE